MCFKLWLLPVTDSWKCSLRFEYLSWLSLRKLFKSPSLSPVITSRTATILKMNIINNLYNKYNVSARYYQIQIYYKIEGTHIPPRWRYKKHRSNLRNRTMSRYVSLVNRQIAISYDCLVDESRKRPCNLLLPFYATAQLPIRNRSLLFRSFPLNH